jgi:hypothetical protein
MSLFEYAWSEICINRSSPGGFNRFGAKTMAIFAGPILLMACFDVTRTKNVTRYFKMILYDRGSKGKTLATACTSPDCGTALNQIGEYLELCRVIDFIFLHDAAKKQS